jgi:riboflavin kinase/FMN adenylyltransferase
MGLPEASLGPTVLTIGSFDGVHLGHQDVISRLSAEAAAASMSACFLTFEPHPRCVLDPVNCPKSITTLAEKLDLVAQLEVEDAIVLTFTPALAQQSGDEFMAELASAMSLCKLVVGYDFALGRSRHGDVAWLAQHGRSHGYEVEVVPAFKLNGEPLHSSEIRRLLTLGEVGAANRMLGRPFSLSGLVEPGDRVGRQLGYPTVNIAVEANKIIPGRGVYAGRVTTPEGEFAGALNVGYRPTFAGTQLRVEAYLLDFSGDLYQQRLQVAFVARLRDEVKFPSAAALAEQIGRDVEETRRLVHPG